MTRLDDLLQVQKALLDLHNHIVSVRMGISDINDDDKYWALTKGQFGPADATLRRMMREEGAP